MDTLTGDCELLQTDLVMDVGASLNPAIDIGQVEGASIVGCRSIRGYRLNQIQTLFLDLPRHPLLTADLSVGTK